MVFSLMIALRQRFTMNIEQLAACRYLSFDEYLSEFVGVRALVDRERYYAPYGLCLGKPHTDL